MKLREKFNSNEFPLKFIFQNFSAENFQQLLFKVFLICYSKVTALYSVTQHFSLSNTRAGSMSQMEFNLSVESVDLSDFASRLNRWRSQQSGS